MSTRVFGVGVSRTGTSSLKVALERLGYGPCYHVSEAVKWPHLALLWGEFLERGGPELQNILGRYRSACDTPIYIIWRDLLRSWPDAKFILTIRDSESWYRSVVNSILPILHGMTLPLAPGVEFAHRMFRDAFMMNWLKSPVFQREIAVLAFTEHSRVIVRSIPPNQLLVMRISEGWLPLCTFLGVPVPDADFPHENSSILNRESEDGLKDI